MLEKSEPFERKGNRLSVDCVAQITPHLDWYRAQGNSVPSGVVPLLDYAYDGSAFSYYYADDDLDTDRPVTRQDRAVVQAAIQPMLAWFQAAGHSIEWLSVADVHWGQNGCIYIAPRFVPITRSDNIVSIRPRRSVWQWLVWLCVGVGLLFLVLLGVYTRPSAQSDTVVVPNVVGMTVANAKQVLSTTQFQLNHQYNVQVPSGSVIMTIPPAGRAMKASRQLRVMVSKGLPALMVPNCIGKSVDQSRVLATEGGFVVTVASGNYSRSEPVGMVIAQVPTPDAIVTADAVQLVPSLGLPVTIQATPNASLSELTQQVVLDVHVTGLVPVAWGTQSVQIEAHETDRVRVYDTLHAPGDPVDVRVPVVSGTRIGVYFNKAVLVYERVYAP